MNKEHPVKPADELDIVACPVCGVYVSASSIQRHVVKKHPDRCGGTDFPVDNFPESPSLTTGRSFMCEDCGEYLPGPGARAVHVYDEHGKVVKGQNVCLECKECGQLCYSDVFLTNHLRKQHGVVPEYAL